MRVVFWQNILSFYQVPHITALAAHPDTEVVWVVQQAITPDRVAQGWKVPDVPGVQLIVAPEDDEIGRLVGERPEGSIHIFSGIHQEPVAHKAFYLAVRTPARIGLLNEAPFPGRLRDIAMPPFHWGHRLLFGRRIGFILAMGHMAVDFYKSVGYPDSVIFPYGYFPDPPKMPAAAPTFSEGPVQIFYLGQLIERKGIDLLLDALGTLHDLDWRLQIVGGGDQKDALGAQVQTLGLTERVKFHAPMENAAAMELMAASDLFVLPSRHDGWGVVVNEALLRGVPVICSDRCGASDLLKSPERGEVFHTGSVPSLAAALRRRIVRGRRTAAETGQIQGWAQCIAGPSVGAYLMQIIRWTPKSGPRPVAPWLAELKDQVGA